MKENILVSFLIVLALFFFNRVTAQELSNVTPFYDRDSVTIQGRVIDDLGNPIQYAYVLFSPFKMKKYDVTWYEKDTTVSDKNGNFTVMCARNQLARSTLYLNKRGYFTTSHFLQENFGNIFIDTAIVLHERRKYWFDTRKINQQMLGMTMAQALNFLKLNVSQSFLMQIINADKVRAKALRVEAADSSTILLIVKDYSDSSNKKMNIMFRKITGIGIAFTNGEKRFFGNAVLHKRRVYNEYFYWEE